MRFTVLLLTAALFPLPGAAEGSMLDDREIRIRNEQEASAVRTKLIEAIWKRQGFPAGLLPQTVETGVAVPTEELTGLVSSVDRLTVPSELGLPSVVYHLRPINAAKRLIVVHQGHDHELFNNGVLTSVRFFLGHGYDVLALYMPLKGPNKFPDDREIKSHDDLIKLASDALPYHPMKLFLEPVIVGINHVLTRMQPEQIAMIGISGGGWTTTLAAALDPRIQFSFPVAGTLPLYLRGARDKGDLEQYTPDIYGIAGFPDLYVLGASGPGRVQVQILNHEDPCCFAVKTEPEYVAQVQARVAEIGPGQFECRIDTTHAEHTISRHALDAFVWPILNE